MHITYYAFCGIGGLGGVLRSYSASSSRCTKPARCVQCSVSSAQNVHVADILYTCATTIEGVAKPLASRPRLAINFAQVLPSRCSKSDKWRW